MSTIHSPAIPHARHVLPLVAMALSVLYSPLVLAEEKASTLLEKIQANSFSIAPSVSISANQGTEPQDPRIPEITARLRDRVNTIQAIQHNQGISSQTGPSGKSRTRQLTDQIRQGLDETPEVMMNLKTRTPRQIKGKKLQRALHEFGGRKERAQHTAQAFLKKFKDILRLKDPDHDLALYKTERDELDRTHMRYAQMHQGLRVWPAELIVHLNPEGDVDLMSGCYMRLSNKLILEPIVTTGHAQALAKKAISNGSTATLTKPALIIYAPINRTPRLAWKMDLSISLASDWSVIIDAINGATLEVVTNVMDANVSGSGVDLFGTTRPLNVWEEDGTFFLVDTSKPMFDPTSDPPQSGTTRGGIFSLDARNQDPDSQGQIELFHVISNNANGGWVSDGVSANFGLSQTYDYFFERHNRNSLDGQGGNIRAITRFGSQTELNAFWNGNAQIMVFLSGPIVRALDVVGHELSHAVTEKTAGLVYMNQSGALNESFSDIFGEMVETRSKGGSPDWLSGADIGNPFRDMKDPSSLEFAPGRPYPSKMSEFVQTSQDNGGVHINSSIINHAFYLLAEGLPGAIGLIDAERIFYRTLTTKLVAGSEFIDARLGAMTSAEELFGANSIQAQLTAQAFDTVEIFSSTPTPEPTPEPTPFPEVNGPDSTIFAFINPQNGALFLGRREEALADGPGGSFLSTFDIAQTRPSVTGDGELATFIDSVNDQCLISTDGSAEEVCLELPGTFFSVAMSFDANRFAMVLRDQQSGEPENAITFIDLDANITQSIPLQAPVLDGGTVEVLRADALDFSANGEVLIYDGLNQIQFEDGTQLGLWSIYSLDLATSTITTLIPPTEGFDLGNPSLSQTSDQFLAFEAADQATGDVQIVLADLFTGNFSVGPTTISGATALVFPGYTGDDLAIVYAAPDSTPSGFSLFRQALSTDHMTFSGSPSLWLNDGVIGGIYRRGSFSGGQSLTLSVTKSGQGDGLVTSVPSGIICGDDCEEPHSVNTAVTLSARPFPGSTFSGWSGGGCSGTGACTVTMTGDVSITPTFTTGGPPPTEQTSIEHEVFPTGRAVQVGDLATAFLTITNTGPTPAVDCAITPLPSIPSASFLYAPVDPVTSALTGPANTPVDIPSGTFQKFNITFVTNGAFTPIEVQFNVTCTNTTAAATASGLNTLLLSASSTPVADMVALTSAPNGTLILPSPSATGPFLIASLNLGAPDLMTMSADTGTTTLPVGLLVCEFNATLGTCFAPPSTSTSRTIATGEITFYAVFVVGQGTAIAQDPVNNRVFVRWRGSDTVVRGLISVGIQTP